MADSPALPALLDPWYRAHARSLPWRVPPGGALPADPAFAYRVWLSEIMLQQTTVPVVQGYFANFLARWPDVAALAAADDADVMQAWAGLGYYARARNLLACAREVVARHEGRFPADEAALRALPGIGDYTAAAIAAFAFGLPAVVVDGNIERVASRLFAVATPLPAARAAIRAALAPETPAVAAGDFYQGLMDLARRVCTPRNPACLACPLQVRCQAAALGKAEAFPVKPAKRPRPLRHGIAWWLEADGQVFTHVRPAKGLLGGMRALPSTDWATTQPDATPPVPGDWAVLGLASHGFTHFELALQVQGLRLPEVPAGLDSALPGGAWLPLGQVTGAGLPTVFAKAAALGLNWED
ncbi:MAG: NUDIX domain-containing protein [Sphingomonadales bacterium]|jgi:A/G-specific adenine glycosylase